MTDDNIGEQKKIRKTSPMGKFNIPRSDPTYMTLWFAANRDAVLAKNAKNYAENREAILAQQKEYNERPENQGKALARATAWQKANPEKVRARISAWRKAHPEARAAEKARRTSLIVGASGSHTKAEAKAILVAQKYICANPYCLADLTQVKPHLDHRVALTKGGSNNATNLQWLCVTCNTRKNNTDWDHWLSLQHTVFGQDLIG